MIVRPDVDTLMAGELGQWLAQQDDRRAEAKRTAMKRWLTGAPAVPIVPAILWQVGVPWNFVFFAAFVVAAVVGVWGYVPIGRLVSEIKVRINSAIAEALGLQYALAAEAGPEFELGRKFQMLPSHDKRKFQDRWWGEIGGQPFQLYEAKLEEERRDSKGNTSTRTVFAGSILTVGYARQFHGHTLVERQGRRTRFFGGERDDVKFGDVRLGRCDMVDPAFEDQFTVWSDDPVEARYLVHPEYIERLVAVERAFAGDRIRALFCGGQLMVILESGDLFESGTIRSGMDRALLQRTIDQFGSLADLAVKLNEKPR